MALSAVKHVPSDQSVREYLLYIDGQWSPAAHGTFAGGIKGSGFGREGGRYSMEEMTELKWITIQLGQRQFPF